jgi:hypothetical protein
MVCSKCGLSFGGYPVCQSCAGRCSKRNYRINRKSPAYHRLVSAGFSFSDTSRLVTKRGELFAVFMTCVCGKVERLALNDYRFSKRNPLDVASLVESVGAIGIKHLKQDGYNNRQIMNIRKQYWGLA